MLQIDGHKIPITYQVGKSGVTLSNKMGFAGFILDRSEHRATLVAAAGSVFLIGKIARSQAE
jgi:hypothetical protein